MSPHDLLTRHAYENELTVEQLRTTLIVHLGLMAGPALFAIIVGFLALQSQKLAPDPGDLALIRMLTLAHLGVAAFALPASRIVPERIFSPASGPKSAAECFALQRTAIIVRLGFLQGPTILGLVTCLTGVVGGVLPAMPIYWLNLASLAILLLVGTATLPTKDRLVAWFERRFTSA